MKKHCSGLMAALLLCLCLVFGGCQSNPIYNPNMATDTEAIDYVLNYVVEVKADGKTTTQLYAARIIGGTLGFANFYNPKYATTHAEQNDDGSITVIAEGSMSGELKSGKTGKKLFRLTAVITSKEEPPAITVEETASL